MKTTQIDSVLQTSYTLKEFKKNLRALPLKKLAGIAEEVKESEWILFIRRGFQLSFITCNSMEELLQYDNRVSSGDTIGIKTDMLIEIIRGIK